MSITNHLKHTTCLCVAHIGKVSQNQWVICLIRIYNMPRTSLPSLPQKWTHLAPNITLSSLAPMVACLTSGTDIAFSRELLATKPVHMLIQEKVCRMQLAGVKSFFPPWNTGVDPTAPLDKLFRSTCFQKKQMKQIKQEERRWKTKKTCVFSTYMNSFSANLHSQGKWADMIFNVILFVPIKTVYLFIFLSTLQRTLRNTTKLYGSTSNIMWYFLLLGSFILIMLYKGVSDIKASWFSSFII